MHGSLNLSRRLKSYLGRLFKTNDVTTKSHAIALVAQLQSSLPQLKLDLGCGEVARDGFIGVDLHPRATVPWNLTWGLPFGDDTVAEIRSDHCFEHLNMADLSFLLRECHRVMVKAAVLDFTVPHLDPYITAYLKKDWDFFTKYITDLPNGQTELYGTCFDRLAWLLLRDGEHKTVFDKDSIVHKVRLAGFCDVQTRGFNPERDVNFRFSSIYVVARK
jgi:predicted SAM-dependent methyltransferase